MKKQLLILSLVTLIGGCNSNSIINSKMSNGSLSSPLEVEGVKNENLKELARQTVLGFSSLANLPSSTLARRDLETNEIEEVKKALGEVDILLNDEANLIVEEIESTKDDYKHSLSLKFTMLEKEENFTLFYNDINIKEEIEKDDHEEEVEVKSSFKGIALFNELEYNFMFSSEEEKENDEIESESSFKLFLGEKSFIRIKQGFEEEKDEKETFYSYTYVDNGKTIEEYKFKEEMENEHGKLEHHVDLEKNGRRYKINYEIKDGEELIRVALKVDNEETAIGYFKRIINSETKEISYEHLVP